MPASAAVEELAAARAQEREDVLEVGCGAGRGAEGRRMGRATARGEEDEGRETAADLEAARADVLVRQPIAREMKDRTEQDRREPRPGGGAGRGTSSPREARRSRLRPSRRPRETRADATSRAWRAEPPQDTLAEVAVAFQQTATCRSDNASEHGRDGWPNRSLFNRELVSRPGLAVAAQFSFRQLCFGRERVERTLERKPAAMAELEGGPGQRRLTETPLRKLLDFARRWGLGHPMTSLRRLCYGGKKVTSVVLSVTHNRDGSVGASCHRGNA